MCTALVLAGMPLAQVLLLLLIIARVIETCWPASELCTLTFSMLLPIPMQTSMTKTGRCSCFQLSSKVLLAAGEPRVLVGSTGEGSQEGVDLEADADEDVLRRLAQVAPQAHQVGGHLPRHVHDGILLLRLSLGLLLIIQLLHTRSSVSAKRTNQDRLKAS